MSDRILSDWIDSYLVLTENSEPPKTFRLWSAIVTISAVLQRKCLFRWGSLTFYPNMYVVLVGPPASRKGTAMDQAFPFLDDLDIKIAAESTTREALIRALKETSDTDVSMEDGLTMAFHSSLVIWAQELTVFLGYHQHQLMSDLTDWYDCRNRWTYRTKHMGTDDIVGVWVTLFGATTPDLIRSSLPLDAIGGGLTSRMIFIYEQNKGKIVPYPGYTKEELALREDLANDLARIRMLEGEFQMTKAFVTFWIDWYIKQEGNPPFKDSKFAGYFERRAAHVMKLSMIVNASRTSRMVLDETDLKRAINILELTEKKMPHTFSGVGQSPYSDVLAKVMVVIGERGEIMLSELTDIFKNDADAWVLDKVITTLQQTNFLIRSASGSDTTIHHKETWLKERAANND